MQITFTKFYISEMSFYHLEKYSASPVTYQLSQLLVCSLFMVQKTCSSACKLEALSHYHEGSICNFTSRNTSQRSGFFPWLLLCMLLIIVMTNLTSWTISILYCYEISSPVDLEKLGHFNYGCLGELLKALAHSHSCMKLHSHQLKLLVHIAGDSLE